MSNTARDAKLTEIALKYFYGEVETLEVRGMDDLDFHTVGVASLKAALVAAYVAGHNDGFQEVARYGTVAARKAKK